MNDQQAIDSGPGDVKTCPSCGGAWPAARSHCLACGASLAGILAHLPENESHDAPFDWRWLDALVQETGEEAVPQQGADIDSPGGTAAKKRGPGWLARLLGRGDKES